MRIVEALLMLGRRNPPIIRRLAGLLMVAACRPADAGPAAVNAADFRTIRWIEGTWRGTGGGVEPFFEHYRMPDDTTLMRYSFADSSLATVSDSAHIVLRGGRVVEPAHDPAWQVTAFDSASWRFEHLREPGRAYTWRFVSTDQWTARLEWLDAQGRPQERLYTLDRMPR